MKRVGIIGCGWLGLPLGLALQDKGWTVIGTSRSDRGVQALTTAGLAAVRVCIADDGTFAGRIDTSLLTCDTLIITLPFKRSFSDPTVYFSQLSALCQAFQDTAHPHKRLLFTSSTSIYPTTNTWVDESTPIVLDTPRKHVLYRCEQTVLTLTGVTSYVLRLAGLFGGTRRIGQFFKHAVLQDPESRVNLIHRQDVIALIITLLETAAPHGIYNCVCNHHPKKGTLYQAHAPALQLAPFPKDPLYKLVCHQKSSALPGFSYQTRSLYDTYD